MENNYNEWYSIFCPDYDSFKNELEDEKLIKLMLE